jgi:hypothetical protein
MRYAGEVYAHRSIEYLCPISYSISISYTHDASLMSPTRLEIGPARKADNSGRRAVSLATLTRLGANTTVMMLTANLTAKAMDADG